MLGIWPFQPAADIWSLGCLAFELVTGDTLFDPQLPEGVDESALDEGDFIKDESHLQQCLELIGPIPKYVGALLARAARTNAMRLDSLTRCVWTHAIPCHCTARPLLPSLGT